MKKTMKSLMATAILLATNVMVFAQDTLSAMQDTVTTVTNASTQTEENRFNPWWLLLLLLIPILYFAFRKKPVDNRVHVDRQDHRTNVTDTTTTTTRNTMHDTNRNDNNSNM